MDYFFKNIYCKGSVKGGNIIRGQGVFYCPIGIPKNYTAISNDTVISNRAGWV